MPYFQGASGALHYLSDADIANNGESLLPTGCTSITDAQAEAIQKPPLTLAQAQAQQNAAIDAAYAAASTANLSFKTAAGVTQTFQADTNSQNILLQSYTGFSASGSVPTGFYWVAADNTQVPFTLADLKGLYAAMLAQGWTAFQQLQERKASIRAATTVAAVQAIVW